MPDLNNIAIHFSPELILTAGILVILLYDLVIRGKEGAQAWLAGLTLLLALAATLWLYPQAPLPNGLFEVRSGSEVIRAGAFVSDGFTHFFRVIGLLTTFLVLLAGADYFKTRTPFKGEFYALLLSCALAMNLMAGANDLLIIALAIEFLSISSYVLTAFRRGDRLSSEAGLKYFLYGSITSAVMLFGMSLLFGVTASTSLPVIARLLADPAHLLVGGLGSLVLPALVMILAGVGFKIALVPFHQWSPDAYEGAPTPVTAFLSVGPKAAGFAVLIRFLLNVYATHDLAASWHGLLGTLAIATMVVGNLVALSQTNAKRMMAYSSIAQAGYMLVGLVSLGAGKLAGIDPVGSILFFILAYLFTNLGVFAVIIAVDHLTGSSDISAFAGLMQRSPVLAVSLFIFFLSLVGIPPLAGFVGKFAVFGAAVAAGQGGLALIGVMTGVISVGYYFRIVREMFLTPAAEGAGRLRVPPTLLFVVVVALVMTFAVGLYPAPFLQFSNEAAKVVQPALRAVVEKP
jgi:proton-translocating NADH-quinone oxidoreductase chain N